MSHAAQSPWDGDTRASPRRAGLVQARGLPPRNPWAPQTPLLPPEPWVPTQAVPGTPDPAPLLAQGSSCSPVSCLVCVGAHPCLGSPEA